MSSCFTRLGLAISLGTLLAGLGCGATSPDELREENTREAELPIAEGYLDSESTSVVGIYATNLGGICTGSLIAPNLVLTARHCVSHINTANGQVDCNTTVFAEPGAAQNYLVTTKPQLGENPADYHKTREVVLLPDGDKLCGQDMAMLILADNIAPSEAVPLVPRIDQPVDKGEEYYAVGYGAVNDQGAGAGSRRRRDELFVSCVSDACPALYTKPTEWVGDEGVCQGDSGGPAIDLQGRVIGVTSRGSLGCDNPVYGYVHSWSDWVKETAKHAALVGEYAPPAWVNGFPTDPVYSFPTGDACTAPADCTSGRCINDGVAQYCTRVCSDVAPCPSGWSCGPDSGGTNVCFEDHAAEQAAADESSSCSVKADPTKPIPWRALLPFGLGLVALGCRRRAR